MKTLATVLIAMLFLYAHVLVDASGISVANQNGNEFHVSHIAELAGVEGRDDLAIDCCGSQTVGHQFNGLHCVADCAANITAVGTDFPNSDKFSARTAVSEISSDQYFFLFRPPIV